MLDEFRLLNLSPMCVLICRFFQLTDSQLVSLRDSSDDEQLSLSTHITDPGARKVVRRRISMATTWRRPMECLDSRVLKKDGDNGGESASSRDDSVHCDSELR